MSTEPKQFIGVIDGLLLQLAKDPVALAKHEVTTLFEHIELSDLANAKEMRITIEIEAADEN